MAKMTDEEISYYQKLYPSFKKYILPFELGIGLECTQTAYAVMQKIDSYNNPAYVWELLLLLSNGIEHTQKAIIEYNSNLKIVDNEFMLESNYGHNLIKGQEILNQKLGVQLTDQELELLQLLRSFQKPNNRFENSQRMDNNIGNLEQRVKNYVKYIIEMKFEEERHRLIQNNQSIEKLNQEEQDFIVDDKIIGKILGNYTASILHKYYQVIDDELAYAKDSHSATKLIFNFIKEHSELNPNDLRDENQPYVQLPVRSEYDVSYDIKIGQQLLSDGLVALMNAPDCAEPVSLWVSALLMANGLEKIAKSAILNQYQRGSNEYLTELQKFKGDSTHDLNLVYKKIEEIKAQKMSPEVTEFIKVMSDFVLGVNRYENLYLKKPDLGENQETNNQSVNGEYFSLPDYEVRFINYLENVLFKGVYNKQTVNPKYFDTAFVAYKFQDMIIELCDFCQMPNSNIIFDPIIKEERFNQYSRVKKR